MKSVVTGGAGFIGSHLVERLASRGDEILVIDNLSSGSGRVRFIESISRVEEGDIRDDQISRLIESFNPDVIFHLAAQMDIRKSVEDPAYDADVNIVATLKLITVASNLGARFINTASGGAMFGELPLGLDGFTEDSASRPVSPYGISKRVGEEYLRFFREVKGLNFVNIAPANVYGPRQDPHGEAGVVAIFGSRLLSGEECSIYGDGKQTRDYVYVSDVVDAYVSVIDLGEGETFNIGTGLETSVLDLYSLMAEAVGIKSEPRFEPERPGELKRVALDISKAERLLGWTPSTPLDAGVALTIESLRSNAS